MVWLLIAAFALTIPAANWLIGNVGVVCVAQGPCLLPVWPGIMAPSGVAMIGLALVLRDLIHERAGLRGVSAAIAVGAALSYWVAPPALALASLAAFVLAEALDTAVYHPLRQRGLVLAVLASTAVGLLVNTVVFLQLAFGSLAYAQGQVLGKVWGTLAALTVLVMIRRTLGGVANAHR